MTTPQDLQEQPQQNPLLNSSPPQPSFKPLQLCFPLLRAVLQGTNIYIHLSLLERALLLFLTTSSSSGGILDAGGIGFNGLDMGIVEGGGGGGGQEERIIAEQAPPMTASMSPLGSFVCALPDVRPLSFSFLNITCLSLP